MNSDYTRVAAAIHYLDHRYQEQPSLSEVAGHVGLSPFHFQRLFRRWAGISPKRFLEFVTLGHAKRMLAESHDVLSASHETGLSGPGRLHDLFVSIEAMSPGEYKRGGEGLTLRYGVHPTPFGACAIALTRRGVCALWFQDDDDPATAAAALREQWPHAHLVEDRQATAPVARQAFAVGGGDPAAPLTLHVQGTNFQVRVWEALLRIPPGRVVSYRDVAESIGRPRAVRAVASACARNPVAALVPCHRVILGTGHIGRYRWGETRKKALLATEAARAS